MFCLPHSIVVREKMGLFREMLWKVKSHVCMSGVTLLALSYISTPILAYLFISFLIPTST